MTPTIGNPKISRRGSSGSCDCVLVKGTLEKPTGPPFWRKAAESRTLAPRVWTRRRSWHRPLNGAQCTPGRHSSLLSTPAFAPTKTKMCDSCPYNRKRQHGFNKEQSSEACTKSFRPRLIESFLTSSYTSSVQQIGIRILELGGVSFGVPSNHPENDIQQNRQNQRCPLIKFTALANGS